ncbi:MAG: hypothetical protein K0U98_04180 [Deltaproteobacteria bacterium]|nr:hypothetical protein [Deltaproteobacteria bacterium]
MRRIHLLRFEADVEELGDLVAELEGLDLRAGWLEFSEPEPLPQGLASAAATGVLRAVAVGSQGAVTIKPRRGEAVLKDLLREHFGGCQVVFVRGGEVEAPRLRRRGSGWAVVPSGGKEFFCDDQGLARRLRRPRPWSG